MIKHAAIKLHAFTFSYLENDNILIYTASLFVLAQSQSFSMESLKMFSIEIFYMI